MSQEQRSCCAMPMKEREEQETLTAPSCERDPPEGMIVEEASDGSSDRDEEGENFHDWVLSYEEVKAKEIEAEKNKKQYSKSNSEINTPSNEATDVPVNSVNENETLLDYVNYRHQRIQDLLKKTHYVKEVDSMLRICSKIVQILKAAHDDRRIPLQPVENVESDIVPDMADDSLQGSPSQSNQSLDEVKQNDKNINENKGKKPDDAVFATNKKNKIGAKKVSDIEAVEQGWVPIGSGMTLIHPDQYKKINWKSYTIATRTLLVAVFSRRVLATHSLTGKPSPAFQDKPAKMCLDSKKVSDVIAEIVDRFKVRENLVRSIITTKCADECKMWKTRCKKNASKKKTKAV